MQFDELLGKGAMKSVYHGFDTRSAAWNQASLGDVLWTPDAVQRMYSEAGLKKPLGKPRFTAVTGLTGPDQFRSGPVRYSPNSNLKFEKNAEKIPKNSS
jgi:hypothetical protein